MQIAVDPGPTSSLLTLPLEGEALLTMAQMASALGVDVGTAWGWAKTDPDFPALVRRGSKFTRVRLSDARRYIAGMGSGTAKESPTARRKKEAA